MSKWPVDPFEVFTSGEQQTAVQQRSQFLTNPFIMG
jgi:hypothetical protein